MDKDAFYFPHFSNARSDRKIKRLRKELGLEGYGIYFMILETLRDQQEYKYPVEDIDLLADEFGTSEQKIRTVISNYALFTLDDNEMFFSPKMIMYLQPYLEVKEKKQIAGIKGNLIKHGHATKEDLEGFSNNDILLLQKELKDFSHCDNNAIAIKVKEIKEKKINKSKLNEINIPSGLSEKLTNKLEEFISYRKQIKKPIKTDRVIASLVNNIGKEFYDEDHLIACIENTMNNEYQGVKAEYLKNYSKSVPKINTGVSADELWG